MFVMNVCHGLPWIRVSKVIVRWAVDEKGDPGRMKSKPRSDELSPSHQSGTCSWSVQSQMTFWPHTSKQQVWQHNNCNRRSWHVIDWMD